MMTLLLLLLLPVVAIKLTGGDPFFFFRPKITLIHFDDLETTSRVHKVRGQQFAYVHPLTKMGKVILLEDGKIHAASEASFIYNWKEA